MNLFGKLFIWTFIYSLVFNSYVICRISNERRCVDAQCSLPISFARTLLRYSADDSRLLSFSPNQKAKIFSKEAGDNPTFWEAEINGKRGYVPKGLLREEKVLVKSSDLKYIVPTGHIEKPVHNVSDSTTENTGSIVPDTPKLPVVNSKGLFSMMSGVSADSVPPSPPDIKPHSTKGFQVFDGTTLYDDHVNDHSGTFPEQVEKMKETPDVSSSENSSETPPEQVHKKEEVRVAAPFSQESSEIPPEQVHNAKETPDVPSIENSSETLSEQVHKKEEIPVALSSQDNTDIAPQHVKEKRDAPSSQETKPGENEALSSDQNVSSDIPTENVVESGVLSEDTKTPDALQDYSNNAESIQPETGNVESGGLSSKSGLLNQFVNGITDLISSGIGPSESENDEDEYEEISEEDEKELQEEEKDKEEMPSKLATTTQSDEIKPQILQEDVSDINVDVNHSPSNSEQFSKSPNISQIMKKDNLSTVNIDSNILHSNLTPNEFSDPNHMADNEDKINRSSTNQNVVDNTPLDVEIDSSVDNIANDSSSVVTDPISIETNPTLNTEENGLGNEKINDEESTSLVINDTMQEEHLKPLHTNDSLETITKIDSKDKLTSVYNKANILRSGLKDESEIKSEEEMSTKAPNQEQKEMIKQDNAVKPVFEPEFEQTTSRDFLYSKINMQNDSVMKTIQASTEISEEPESPSVDTNLKPENTTPTPIEIPAVLDISSPLKQQFTEKPNFASTVGSQSITKASQTENKDTSEVPDSSDSSTTEVHSDQFETVKEESQEDSVEVVTEIPTQKITPSTNYADIPNDVKVAEEDSTEKMFDESSRGLEDILLTEAPAIVSEDEKEVEDDVTYTVTDDSSEGIFSFLYPIFDIFRTTATSDDMANDMSSNVEGPKDTESLDASRTVFIKDESCLAGGVGEEACDVITGAPISKDVSWQDTLYSADISGTLDLLNRIPLETTVWLIVTAVVVLIFSLGHYYIEAHRRDGPLVATINKLEREVLILKKEACIMEDRLQTNQEQLEAWTTNSSENDALIVELKQELEETKAAKLELEEQVAILEREVETVTESGLEMHRLLEESLSSQDGSQVLLSTVQSLREKLEHQENEITGLSQSLSRKNIEVDELQEKLAQSADVARGLEDRIIAVTRAKEEEALQLKDSQRQLMAQLEEVMETKALDETRVSAEMSHLRLAIEELQKTLAGKESELEAVKEVVKQLRSTDSNDKMDALFDVAGMSARLKSAVTERDELREKFHEEEGARKLLEGHMKKITQEVTELKNSFETAEKEKIEALTKLQVLSNYFKEKESQLQKELGLQESMWLQKQSDDHTIYEQMRSLREENEKYKLQNESLKKEIVEQESSFKIQLANVEQKSHENWVASRQAERRLKEVQQEAAQLRNRLTTNSANYSLDDSKQNISESNGDPSSPPPSLIFPPAASPPFMMYPMPPPGDFVPPPPLMSSPYHSDSRPPPLGRISSPPLDHRFSPPPPLPYPPYDYPPYGHHSPSPPPPMPSHSHHRTVHKPQPRDMSREQKDHVMSNYSPESEKTIRRNKR